MLRKEQKERQSVEMVCTDMLVPKDHLLRKIDTAVNFDRIYDMVEYLYCEDNGRPSVDPVVLFKLVLIQNLYGIRSLRQTVKDAEVNVAYRWFIGYTMAQPISHFATISYAFATRFPSDVIEQVFTWILEEANEAGYLDPSVVFADGTHIKANANLKKHIKKDMLCTDMLVPKEHLLRKIEAAANFDRIYEMVEHLYCNENGRSSVDPIVLFKPVLIQHLYGIRSLRQTVKAAEVNVAYR